MDENKPKNIFEAAGKAKKPMPSKGGPSSSPKKEEPPSVEVNPEKLLDLHRDPEINLMLNKMLQMQENFQTKLNEVYDSAGISSNQIRNFLDNPSNFTPSVWQRIQGQRDSLEKKINEILKINIKKEKKGQILGGTAAGGKERKSKTLGSRKNWIPM